MEVRKMNQSQRMDIIENAKILAKRKKEYNPFNPMKQNSEFILWQQTYHSEIKYTPRQWERIKRMSQWSPALQYKKFNSET